MKSSELLLLLLLCGITSNVLSQGIKSSAYYWEKLEVIRTSTGEERIYVQSPTLKLEKFDMKAITLNAHRTGRVHKVEKGSDELLIIKEGVAEIKVNKDSEVLGEGSVVVASSGDKVSVSNTQNADAVFYSVSFKPHSSGSGNQSGDRISPLYVDWNKVEFRPSVNGGVRSIIRKKTSSLSELEIHVTTIKEGITSRGVTSHPEEGFVLIRKGIAGVNLDGNHYKGSPGSLFFLASNCPHSISNIGSGDCEYYAAKWFTDLPALK